MRTPEGRTAPDDDGDYPYEASRELITGICLIGRAVEQLTGDDLCNWQTSTTYRTDVFTLRGSNPDGDLEPNFAYGPAGTPAAIDVAWYKEAGRCTTVSRIVDVDEVVDLVTACLRSLPTIPDLTGPVYVYAGDAGQEFVDRLLAAAAR